jgi:hypothetical protein
VGNEKSGVTISSGVTVIPRRAEDGSEIVNMLDPIHRAKVRHLKIVDGAVVLTEPDTERTYIGFMADEVEKVCPEAITVFNGIRMVNYDIVMAKQPPGLNLYSWKYKNFDPNQPNPLSDL